MLIHLVFGRPGLSRRGRSLLCNRHLSRRRRTDGILYDLVGDGFCRTLHISYDPARPNADSAVFRDLPPGEYRILENGVERSRVQISMENPSAHVRPDNTWPTAPPR